MGASLRNVLIDRGFGFAREGFVVGPGEPPVDRGVNRQPLASVTFEEEVIRIALRRLGLPESSPLSVLAVELLPGDLRKRVFFDSDRVNPRFEDPLGADLGLRRILRASPLVAVPSICDPSGRSREWPSDQRRRGAAPSARYSPPGVAPDTAQA